MTLAVLGTGVKLSHCTWFSVLCIIWPLPFPELHLLPVSLLVTPVASLGFISSFLGILFSLSQETGTCSRCWECISSHFLDGLFFFSLHILGLRIEVIYFQKSWLTPPFVHTLLFT